MKKLSNIIFSNKVTLVALVAFAVSMAYATFIENDFGTDVARISIYEAWWFEMVMLILVLNFAGNIFKYKLLSKKKLGILTFHIAFIVTLIGAFVTRYTGQEGLMRIREGQASNQLLTQERYLSVSLSQSTADRQQVLALTQFHQPDVSFKIGTERPIVVSSTKYIPDAVQGLVDGSPQDEVLEVVSASDGSRVSYYLANHGSIYLSGHKVTFNNPHKGEINISGQDGKYIIESSEAFDWMVMGTQQLGRLQANLSDTLMLGALYSSDHLNFVVSRVHQGKKLDFTTAETEEMAKNAADLLFVNLKNEGESKQIILAALDGVYSPTQTHEIGNQTIYLSYGPKIIELPFSLHLSDFQLERYPGSASPSSYASEVIVQDGPVNTSARISMNNVLDYRGYRFFQASYDLDEKGTVLSVNRDFWGTMITYVGYFLMGVGMFITLFSKNARFAIVSQRLAQLQAKKMASTAVILVFCTSFTSLVAREKAEAERFQPAVLLNVDISQASEFGKLMVQDMDGRIKPISTLASEFLRKLTRKTTYTVESQESVRLNSDQVFLSIHKRPDLWQSQPIMAVDKKKGAFLLEKLDIVDRNMLSFEDLLTDQGTYLLAEEVEKIQLKKPAERAEYEKEILKVDERFNILYQALSGNYLKIFPEPNSPDHKWYNSQFLNARFTKEDSLFVRLILQAYYADLESGNAAPAGNKLQYISTFQKQMGSEVYPDDSRVKAELLYNQLNIFNRLFPVYWTLGFYLIVLALARVFFKNRPLAVSYLIGVLLTGMAFLLQTFNLVLRWYAAGYPPWSNGYEMIILVSWALLLFGFIFYSKSDFVLPLVALFTGTLLFVSFLDWLNPEITNLVPVLKSYWLKIHVAIIVSSYAPLALSALLGLLAQVFMIVKEDRFNTAIKELTYINELSMTIGLFLLTIGTFLGGVWANESWGRYWAWDPKETWALISIIVYAVVLHLRFVPGLKGPYTFNVASVIAFFSIIMTSFGVNYYLSGLHSYAAGDPLPIPNFVYWVVFTVLVVAFTAYHRASRKMKYQPI